MSAQSELTDRKALLESLENRLHEVMAEKIKGHVSKVDDLSGTSTAGLSCVVEVASDRNAVIEALAEYGLRSFLEGEDGSYEMIRIEIEAQKRYRAKLFQEVKSRQGRT